MFQSRRRRMLPRLKKSGDLCEFIRREHLPKAGMFTPAVPFHHHQERFLFLCYAAAKT